MSNIVVSPNFVLFKISIWGVYSPAVHPTPTPWVRPSFYLSDTTWTNRFCGCLNIAVPDPDFCRRNARSSESESVSARKLQLLLKFLRCNPAAHFSTNAAIPNFVHEVQCWNLRWVTSYPGWCHGFPWSLLANGNTVLDAQFAAFFIDPRAKSIHYSGWCVAAVHVAPSDRAVLYHE
jgi:hypothetical protein